MKKTKNPNRSKTANKTKHSLFTFLQISAEMWCIWWILLFQLFSSMLFLMSLGKVSSLNDASFSHWRCFYPVYFTYAVLSWITVVKIYFSKKNWGRLMMKKKVLQLFLVTKSDENQQRIQMWGLGNWSCETNLLLCVFWPIRMNHPVEPHKRNALCFQMLILVSLIILEVKMIQFRLKDQKYKNIFCKVQSSVGSEVTARRHYSGSPVTESGASSAQTVWEGFFHK